MALTFLDLTNTALKRLNEVTISEGDFSSVRGFHAHMKDAVNDAIRQINQEAFEWPFNHATGTITCVPGTTLYDVPATCKVVDWDTFFLKPDDALEVDAVKLSLWDYDHYMARRAVDDLNGETGAPEVVYRTQAGGIGISPVPDEAYTIGYEYFGYVDTLVAHSDVTNIPEQFKHVIVDGALVQGYLFRGNQEAALFTDKRFKDGVKQMRGLLLNDFKYAFDTRV